MAIAPAPVYAGIADLLVPPPPPSPVELSRLAGVEPDPWQERVLTSEETRLLLCCSRQSGKSTTVASLAVATAIAERDSLVLLISPTQRQSAELLSKCADVYRSARGTDAKGAAAVRRLAALSSSPPGTKPRTVSQMLADGASPSDIDVLLPEAVRTSALRLEFDNYSRIISLPGSSDTVRGYSGPRLIVIDEAAFVRDELYTSLRPMLAVSGGRLALLSTPHGKRGFFYKAWDSDSAWDRYQVPATECPRISQEFLDEERREIGDWWFQQEYMCRFQEAETAAFTEAEIGAMRDETEEVWNDI